MANKGQVHKYSIIITECILHTPETQRNSNGSEINNLSLERIQKKANKISITENVIRILFIILKCWSISAICILCYVK